MREPFLGAAEVDEVSAEDLERPELRLARADCTSDRERLLADGERLLEAPRQPQPPAERRQSTAARSADGGCCRHELDRVLDAARAASSSPHSCR